MPTNWAGITYPGGTDAPNVPASMAAMAATLAAKVTSRFADANARNAATNSLTSPQKEGVQAYLDDRETFCTWSATSNSWVPVPVHRVLANTTQVGQIDLRQGVDTFTQIMGLSSTTLPPGMRWLRAEISVRAQNIATGGNILAAVPRVSFVSAGVGTVNQAAGNIEAYQPPGDTVPVTLSRTWLFQASGSYSAAVYAYPAGSFGGYVRFSNGTLDITDLGSV